LWVPAGQEAQFLAPLPVRKIPGIGEVTERALRALGIEYVHQLAEAGLDRLEKVFGQWGTALYRKARGGDSLRIRLDAEPKSSRTITRLAKIPATTRVLESMLSHLSQKACKRCAMQTFPRAR
jgi:DNA polymerase-4